MKKKLFSICCFYIVFMLKINAQNVDNQRIVKDSLPKNTPSVSKTKKDSAFIPNPKKAAMYAIIPGGGQIYNRKLWYVRLPLVYGAIGGAVGYLSFNNSKYKLYKRNYFNKVNNLPLDSGINQAVTADKLKQGREYYYKQVQQAYVLTGVVYVLSAAEAFTTAHLLNFDVSENISFKVKPAFEGTPYGSVGGVGLKLQF